MDIETAYSNAPFEKDIVNKQSEDFELLDENGKTFVCKLKKGFVWFETIWKKLVFDFEGFLDYIKFC